MPTHNHEQLIDYLACGCTRKAEILRRFANIKPAGDVLADVNSEAINSFSKYIDLIGIDRAAAMVGSASGGSKNA
ncbi:hypothetical protein [Acidocella facilis]|uniref:hypothetical protein n=1 Tax=Acidocella facilis TaxID=525 RepID=UPI001F30CF10|nr:hypothetical protein [Acidocella facilis]